MNRMAEKMISDSGDSGVKTFASELSQHFSSLVDAAEQLIVDAMSESEQDEDDVESDDVDITDQQSMGEENATKENSEQPRDMFSVLSLRQGGLTRATN